MPFTIKTSDELVTDRWSGGTTTELFIFPETAKYQNRDFDFRISTAKVEAEESDFTSLAGYSRKLMVLNGDVTLHHENHYSKRLNKFEADEFEGSWKTSSAGKCIDFNLMTSSGVIGSIDGQQLKEGIILDIEVNQHVAWFFLYLFLGKLEITIKNKTALVSKGDFVIVQNSNFERIMVKTMETCEVVFTRIGALSN